MSGRLEKLRDELAPRDLDAFLITDNSNVRYLSGFTGSYAVVLATSDTAFLLTDFRYAEQVAEECPDLSLELVADCWIPAACGLIERLDLRRIGFEGGSLNYHDWNELQSGLPSREMISTDDPVGCLRMAKDESELAAIREAVRITDLAFEHVCRVLQPGVTERAVALELDYFMRKNEADREAFDSIVASGPRSALPHGKPTKRRISEGELIVLDFGARWQGYHADITRTVLMGKPDSRQAEIYNVVLAAQSEAISAIRPGVAGRDVDAVARDFIAAKGFGEYFGHNLGHGLGLSVHDAKILARQSDIVLESGIVVTVEPGIYIPGWGGIRIEDDVLVTESGAEVLTRSPKVLSLG